MAKRHSVAWREGPPLPPLQLMLPSPQELELVSKAQEIGGKARQMICPCLCHDGFGGAHHKEKCMCKGGTGLG